MSPKASTDVQWKTFFLGPKSENGNWLLKNVQDVFHHWIDWRKSRFPDDGPAISYQDQSNRKFQDRQKLITSMIGELTEKFECETPKYSPRYIGHMVSEISMTALLGHIICLLHNPNNASKEASKVGSLVEKEAIAMLAGMIGYDPESATGHFTSGGTIANFEALWRARYRFDHWLSMGLYLRKRHLTNKSMFQLAHQGWAQYDSFKQEFDIDPDHLRPFSLVLQGPWQIGAIYREICGENFPEPIVLVPENKHYSWPKGISLMGLGNRALWPVKLDRYGRMDVDDLRIKLESAVTEIRPVMMVTSVAGTTELGVIDPVGKVADLLQDYREKKNLYFWHHIDAAYGGFYCCLKNSTKTALAGEGLQALRSFPHAESVTIDPHKLGYVPYASGCILVKDRISNTVSSFPAPYLIEDSGNEGLWSSTLEGSRSAGGATSTWLTAKTIGLDENGYGAVLETGLAARESLQVLLKQKFGENCHIADTDTNILCFCIAFKGETVSAVNSRSITIYRAFKQGESFSVSKTHIGKVQYENLFEHLTAKWAAQNDRDYIVLLRTVLMNPFVLIPAGGTNYLTEFVEELATLIH